MDGNAPIPKGGSLPCGGRRWKRFFHPWRILVSNDKNGKHNMCQLQGVIRAFPLAGRDEEGDPSWGLKLKWALKRRLGVRAQKRIKGVIGSALDLLDRRRGKTKTANAVPETPLPKRLEAGDTVRVRAREEIEATLDRWRSFKGCGFLDEMAGYCGTPQRVLKRVERFMDERDYRLKKAFGVVLLEGVTCSGTATTGRCDRACFFFWREEWLEKVDGSAGNEK